MNRTSVYDYIVLIDCFFQIITNNLIPLDGQGGSFFIALGSLASTTLFFESLMNPSGLSLSRKIDFRDSPPYFYIRLTLNETWKERI